MFVDKAIMFFIYLPSGFLPLESSLFTRCNSAVSALEIVAVILSVISTYFTDSEITTCY